MVLFKVIFSVLFAVGSHEISSPQGACLIKLR